MKDVNKIVYLHGLDSSPHGVKATHFRKMSEEDNYNFYAPDLGKSLEDVPFQERLKRADEHILPGTYLIGSSLGGYIASLLAQKYPGQIQRLVLIAPAMDFFNLLNVPSSSLYPSFPQVKCPTMVFAGRKDTVVPKKLIDRFVELNPHCEYVHMPDGDHRMHSEMVYIRAYVREFLSRD